MKSLILFTILLPFHSYGIELQILNSIVKNEVIKGAQVILQKNGEASIKTTSNSDGKVSLKKPFGGIDDESVSLIVKKKGFSNLIVKCPCNEMTYALSPSLKNLDGLRVVLSWGSTPSDLDSHLLFEKSHVFFNKKNGVDMNLDVDDQDGYGPETITVEKKHYGKKYLYAIHNYSEGDQKNSSSISVSSKAKVFVYVGDSLVRTFSPPKNKIGNTWVVFGIGENGEFYDINKFADLKREDFKQYLTDIIDKGDFESIPDVNANQLILADSLNKQGEKLYHQKRLNESVELYLEAINNNPEHSQAYSNLGLSYLKLKKYAESLWANRKSIQLATGDNKKTIKASSYYNIAKVYEKQNQFEDALKNFEEALKLKNHNAYVNGIKRMKLKLGRDN